MKQLITVPASVEDMRPRKDRSWKLTFETARELSGEEVKLLTDNYQGDGWLLFSPNEVSLKDIPEGDVEDSVKTPSKRLRAVLHVWWEQKGGDGDFELFYRTKMEQLINQVKDRLEPEDK